jgi:hypothetical protein
MEPRDNAAGAGLSPPCLELTEGAFPGLEPEVVLTDQLFEYDQDLFGVDKMSDSQISPDARKVAEQVAEKYF